MHVLRFALLSLASLVHVPDSLSSVEGFPLSPVLLGHSCFACCQQSKSNSFAMLYGTLLALGLLQREVHCALTLSLGVGGFFPILTI